MHLIDFFSSNPLAFVLVSGILGLMVGSFLNVVIYRLPIMLEKEWKQQCELLLNEDDAASLPDNTQAKTEKFNLIYPNSHCPACEAPVRAWQNIPVLSYIFLKGKCANCKTTISFRYPTIELITGILSLVVAWHFGFTWQAAGMLVLTWSLVALTMIDFDHQLLPDNITLPLLWLGLLLNTVGTFSTLSDAIWGAALGYLSLWSVFWLFKILTGKEGMGYGDFKLLAVLGGWFGWQMLPLIILLSSLVGAIVGIALIVLKNRGKSVPIPFGPYLAAAGWIAAIWGEEITQAYLRYSGLA